ncbi:MAG: 50S ribosomal protein L6 [Proteobacteria bacterium]|nr:50S ribosomal protein L6 [Pseudomonadota bacterium]
MSRIGKHAVKIPSGVNIAVDKQKVSVNGKLGSMDFEVHKLLNIEKGSDFIAVKPKDTSKEALIQWGTAQRQISNIVKGVSEGFTLNLELSGVGYRASVQGNNLVLQLGFSHDIIYPLPKGINAKCDKPTSIALTGYNKQLLGQVAAEIRSHRPPEPYKGKGVIRGNEFVLRKEGKKK